MGVHIHLVAKSLRPLTLTLLSSLLAVRQAVHVYSPAFPSLSAPYSRIFLDIGKSVISTKQPPILISPPQCRCRYGTGRFPSELSPSVPIPTGSSQPSLI